MQQEPKYMKHPILVKHPELIDMIMEAQQDGATHIQVYLFNHAFFFRDQNEKAELCVASFFLRERTFKWALPGYTWRDCEGIPDNATSLAEILNYIRPEPRRSDLWRLEFSFLKARIQHSLFPGIVIPYNPYPREEMPDGVIETAYFRCGDCNLIFDYTAYLGGPITETCESCESHNIRAITEDEYLHHSLPWYYHKDYITSLLTDIPDLPSGIFDPDNDE